MKMTKLEVVSAVEPTQGLSPGAAFTIAKAMPPPSSSRIYAKDYLPAMRELIQKGYTIKAASEALVKIGCPFSAGTLDVTYRKRA